MSRYNPERSTAFFNHLGAGHLPALMGINVLEAGQGFLRAELEVRKDLFAPNGFLHAGTVVTLADTACGYGCSAHLPPGAKGFTTIELKSNHLGTARDGVIEVHAKAVHMGRTTHCWDAEVRHRDTGKVIALFRCTQMIL
ncbi:MAG: PaaI family thioesterase [Ramlibacter sp.]|nr:PaaI family thioesterase [Ramlibacter sp.]